MTTTNTDASQKITLPWRAARPDAAGNWLYVEADGSLHSIYVTEKDLALDKEFPWLGEGVRWCGPIAEMEG